MPNLTESLGLLHYLFDKYGIIYKPREQLITEGRTVLKGTYDKRFHEVMTELGFELEEYDNGNGYMFTRVKLLAPDMIRILYEE